MCEERKIQKTIREYFWYAIYTKSRSERKLYDELCQKNIDCYLPMQKKLRVWSDRKKWVETPLFNSYVFVRVSTKEYHEAINSFYGVCYVTIRGKAVAIPEKQIEALRCFLSDEARKIEITTADMATGDQVEVIAGPLKGVSGEIQEIRGKHRLAIRFESLGTCVLTEIKFEDVKPGTKAIRKSGTREKKQKTAK